jgi:hypothetical protein
MVLIAVIVNCIDWFGGLNPPMPANALPTGIFASYQKWAGCGRVDPRMCPFSGAARSIR